ncbi:hypothetical protein [Sneathiella sp.]
MTPDVRVLDTHKGVARPVLCTGRAAVTNDIFAINTIRSLI